MHAEEFRPGGEVLHGDSPDVAARYAEVLARLMAELADVTVAPPLPNPPWVRWDHADSGVAGGSIPSITGTGTALLFNWPGNPGTDRQTGSLCGWQMTRA